jgi:hypothetical protein
MVFTLQATDFDVKSISTVVSLKHVRVKKENGKKSYLHNNKLTNIYRAVIDRDHIDFSIHQYTFQTIDNFD